MRRLMLTAAAGRQLHQARTWWLENRDKAPEAFDEELLVLFDILETGSSTLGQAVGQRPGVRRLYLKRIRYFVYFEHVSDTEVHILAIWHGRRDELPPR
ncbi:MAG: hypothetical protein CMN30_33600 [Sandaracinus sp.]|nr:hypothetical protein [Sandaracinus sp.]